MEAIAYYRRYGTEPFVGRVERDEETGRPFHRYESACMRCGGAGGADKWAHTGWKCFDCAGSGKGPILRERLYTAEERARLDFAAAKREAKREAKAAAEREARRAPFYAWKAANAHVLEQVLAYGREDHKTQILANVDTFRIPADWLVNGAIMDIVRAGVREDLRLASAHVGEIGKRIDLELTCEKLIWMGDKYRPFCIALMRDSSNNRIVYKGARPPLGEQQTGKFRATVSEHGERNGERQTIVQRLKDLEVSAPSNETKESENGNDVGLHH